MTIRYECYECDRPAMELSPRSRCITCEYRRAQFNEEENKSLRHTLAEYQARIAELEKELENFEAYEDLTVEFANRRGYDSLADMLNEWDRREKERNQVLNKTNWLDKRDLEQQAKGIDDYTKYIEEFGVSELSPSDYANQLRKQAEQMK